MIPLDQVTVLGSNARILTFPAAATIANLGLVPGALHLEVDHHTSWPAVAIEAGGEPAQAATLWVFLQIEGRWHATGAERLRPGQIAGDAKPEDANVDNFIGVSWLFDVNRWGPMAGYVPKVGEHIGMMVVAGSTRSDDTTPVEERTKVFEFAWPGPGGAANIQPVWVEGQAADDQDDQDGSTTDSTDSSTGSQALADIMARLDALDRKLDGLARQADAGTERIQHQIDQAVKSLEASTATVLEKLGQPKPPVKPK